MMNDEYVCQWFRKQFFIFFEKKIKNRFLNHLPNQWALKARKSLNLTTKEAPSEEFDENLPLN